MLDKLLFIHLVIIFLTAILGFPKSMLNLKFLFWKRTLTALLNVTSEMEMLTMRDRIGTIAGNYNKDFFFKISINISRISSN